VSSGGPRSAAQVRADRPRGTLLASSSRWAWAGPFHADEYAPYPGVLAAPNDHIAISATLRPSGYLRETRRGQTFEGPVGAGDAVIIPSRELTEWTGTIPAHVRMAVAPSLVAEAADDIHGTRARRARIADVLHTADPVLARLAELIVAELRAPDHPAQRLMFDSLAAALVAHLLRAYAGLDEPRAALPALTRRGVGRRRLHPPAPGRRAGPGRTRRRRRAEPAPLRPGLPGGDRRVSCPLRRARPHRARDPAAAVRVAAAGRGRRRPRVQRPGSFHAPLPGPYGDDAG